MPESITYNCDCMEYMQTLPDNHFDLAVVDPPYGAGFTDGSGCKGWFTKYHHHTAEAQYTRFGNKDSRFEKYKRAGAVDWDVAPGAEYFEELFRVSRNQIIWGGNYFPLPPTRCFLVWRKLTISESFTMAMAEYAWTNFNDNAKVFEFAPQGKKGDERFHPTQKPIELYAWVYRLFAKPGDKILDTHLSTGNQNLWQQLQAEEDCQDLHGGGKMTQSEFMDWAAHTVLEYLATHGPFRPFEETTYFLDDIFIVWYCKTLQNHKALLGSSQVSGAYFEFTYNGDRREAYLDAYVKCTNQVVKP